MPLRLLIVATETSDQADARRRYAGLASHETYEETLHRLAPDATLSQVSCVAGPDPLTVDDLRRYDGIFLAGSPIQMHNPCDETHWAAGFMTRVYEAGTPSFGSCAGLQIAAVAAGGSAAPRENGIEAGFARDIVPNDVGRIHPLLEGRPGVFDAPAMHSSVVDRLPDGATLLASNRHTRVEAVEIKNGQGVFWGVQYHPEISIGEIAASLRRQGSELVAQGLAADEGDLEAYAAKLEQLDRHPDRRDIAWQLGLDPQTTDFDRRTIELRNFLRFVSGRR